MALKKIALLYLTEPYQALHMAPLAVAFEKYPSVEVNSLCVDYANQEIIKILYKALKANKTTLENIFRLRPSLKTKFLSFWESISGSTDLLRYAFLEKNKDLLQTYDALVGTENTLAYAREIGITHPKLILVEHGLVGRNVLDENLKKYFDLILFDGIGSVQKSLERRNSLPGTAKAPGYMKLETCKALRENSSIPFTSLTGFVLFNPHVNGRYSSMAYFLPTLAQAFSSGQLKGNLKHLLIAPHVKYQLRIFDRNHRLLKKILTGKVPSVFFSQNIWSSINMDLTRKASIYIGDVSSQIHEFLIQPRPCIFLNPNKIKWENNPAFDFWKCGEVVEDPAMLLTALNRAHEKHAEFLPIQEAFISNVFNGNEGNGNTPSERAADLIMKLLD